MQNEQDITPKNSFGAKLKQLRMDAKLTLREACKETGCDPSNWSKIERGIMPPPKEQNVLENWLKILEIKPKSRLAKEFFELAEIAQGKIPADLLDDSRLVELLPAFFRTMRGNKPAKEEIKQIIQLIREAHDY